MIRVYNIIWSESCDTTIATSCRLDISAFFTSHNSLSFRASKGGIAPASPITRPPFLLQRLPSQKRPKIRSVHHLMIPFFSHPNVAEKRRQKHAKPHDRNHCHESPGNPILRVCLVPVVENGAHHRQGDHATKRHSKGKQRGDSRRTGWEVGQTVHRSRAEANADTVSGESHHTINSIGLLGRNSPSQDCNTNSGCNSAQKEWVKSLTRPDIYTKHSHVCTSCKVRDVSDLAGAGSKKDISYLQARGENITTPVQLDLNCGLPLGRSIDP